MIALLLSDGKITNIIISKQHFIKVTVNDEEADVNIKVRLLYNLSSLSVASFKGNRINERLAINSRADFQ